MSRESIEEMIARVERIADMIPGCSEAELNSLGGQALGTMRAIKSEFAQHGINTDSQEMAGLGDRIIRTNDVSEVAFVFHQAAAYLRGLLYRI